MALLFYTPGQDTTDFIASDGELTLSSTVTENFIEVTIVDDSVIEKPEKFGIVLMVADATMGNIQIVSGVLDITIISDDGRCCTIMHQN